jgi:hypothetical protein
MSCFAAQVLLVEMLLDRGAEGDVAEAHSAIDGLTTLLAEEGSVMREGASAPQTPRVVIMVRAIIGSIVMGRSPSRGRWLRVSAPRSVGTAWRRTRQNRSRGAAAGVLVC